MCSLSYQVFLKNSRGQVLSRQRYLHQYIGRQDLARTGSRFCLVYLRLTTGGLALLYGLSVGYTAKQLITNDYKGPWVGGDKYWITSPALKIGLYWAPEFRYGIGLQGGIYYELSAVAFASGGTNSVEVAEHNVSIPIRVQYRYEIIPDLSVFVYTGPSFDASAGYSIKIDGKWRFDKYEESLDYRQFNLLWGAGVGIRYNCVQLMMGGDWELISIRKSTAARLNKPFFVTLSYVF